MQLLTEDATPRLPPPGLLRRYFKRYLYKCYKSQKKRQIFPTIWIKVLKSLEFMKSTSSIFIHTCIDSHRKGKYALENINLFLSCIYAAISSDYQIMIVCTYVICTYVLTYVVHRYYILNENHPFCPSKLDSMYVCTHINNFLLFSHLIKLASNK